MQQVVLSRRRDTLSSKADALVEEKVVKEKGKREISVGRCKKKQNIIRYNDVNCRNKRLECTSDSPPTLLLDAQDKALLGHKVAKLFQILQLVNLAPNPKGRLMIPCHHIAQESEYFFKEVSSSVFHAVENTVSFVIRYNC